LEPANSKKRRLSATGDAAAVTDAPYNADGKLGSLAVSATMNPQHDAFKREPRLSKRPWLW
jgi:hypothetical protein